MEAKLECEKSYTLSKSQNGEPENGKDRRKHFRVALDLPLEYRVMGIPNAHGALVANGSEMGLLIKSVKNIPIGTKLTIAVLFPRGYELANFEVIAEVVWKEVYSEEDWEGYQYGLKFVSIRTNDQWKLRNLLRGQFELKEISQDI
jgi:hypothetical protein